MEAVVILLFIILIVLILSFRAVALQRIQLLEEEITRLRQDWAHSGLQRRPTEASQPQPGRFAEAPAEPPPPAMKQTEPLVPEETEPLVPRPATPKREFQPVIPEFAKPHVFPEHRSVAAASDPRQAPRPLQHLRLFRPPSRS